VIVPPVGGLSGGFSLGQVEGLANSHAPGAAASATGGVGASAEASGFGGQLTEAISSLEQTQDSASSASQALATGNVSDPESAIVTVQDAQLAMELAGQIRTKATEAIQNIFQTQV
jgi:flagellar hook-basal body complex protein FliE